jgi:hypothetical protein
VGCNCGPDPVLPPVWDPPAQAELALEELDANGDGALDADELKKAPGLAAGAKQIDQNADGKLTAEERRSRRGSSFLKRKQLLSAAEHFTLRIKGGHWPKPRSVLSPSRFWKASSSPPRA